MVTRVVVHQRAIAALLVSDGIRDALENIAEKIQDSAVQITAVEAVDTGLMAASWRVEMIPAPRRWIARVFNKARSEDDHPYPIRIEWGWRHHRSGKHIAGRHILARSIDAART